MIPSQFVRSFEKNVPKVVSNGPLHLVVFHCRSNWFNGLTHNDEYPQEDIDKIRSA